MMPTGSMKLLSMLHGTIFGSFANYMLDDIKDMYDIFKDFMSLPQSNNALKMQGKSMLRNRGFRGTRERLHPRGIMSIKVKDLKHHRDKYRRRGGKDAHTI